MQYLYFHAAHERFEYPSSRAGGDLARLAVRYLECVLVQAASLRLREVDCDLVLVSNLRDRRTIGRRGAVLLARAEALGVQLVHADYRHRPATESVSFASSRYVFDAITTVAAQVAQSTPLYLLDVDCVWLDAPKLFGCARAGEIGCIVIEYPRDWVVAQRTPQDLGALARRLGASDDSLRWIGGELLSGTAEHLSALAEACVGVEREVLEAGAALNTEEHVLSLAGALGRARFRDLGPVAQRVWTGPRHEAHTPQDPEALALLHLPSEKGLAFRRVAAAIASGREERFARDLADPARLLRRFNVKGAGWPRRLRDDGWLATQRLRDVLSRR